MTRWASGGCKPEREHTRAELDEPNNRGCGCGCGGHNFHLREKRDYWVLFGDKRLMRKHPHFPLELEHFDAGEKNWINLKFGKPMIIEIEKRIENPEKYTWRSMCGCDYINVCVFLTLA